MRIPPLAKKIVLAILVSLVLIKIILLGVISNRKNTSDNKSKITRDTININNYKENIAEPINFTTTSSARLLPSESQEKQNFKYILLWTNENVVPFIYLGQGQQAFIDRKCPYTNCYVTAKRTFFVGDYTKFDAIAFMAPDIFYHTPASLPLQRSPRQKYVFASIESSDNYPICHHFLDGFFNWTWTYKLDSDARWGYIVVRDSENKVIGPNKIMHWINLEDMDPVGEEIKNKLKIKSKAAAWVVSNCKSRSKRETFVEGLKIELSKYNLSVDIFGACGKNPCVRKHCLNDLKQYYFYLALENSFSEDYVTEKLLHGLQYNAVPIVYGGANYTRFMPDGMYLDGRKLSTAKLAKTMNNLIKNPEQYYEYFRWKNHYSFHSRDESLDTNDYCRFCAMLNDDELMRKTTVYKEFASWWNPKTGYFRL